MGGDTFCRKASAIAHAFYDTGNKGGTVQAGKFARQGYVRVNHGLIVEKQVLGGILVGALESIGGAAEQVAVECLGDELKQRQDTCWTDRGERVGGAGEQQVEEADADGVALVVQAEKVRQRLGAASDGGFRGLPGARAGPTASQGRPRLLRASARG